jgi:hypothetical protein
MNPTVRPLWLDWNLGLGDAIICNGLVRFLASHSVTRKIVLPCWERNLPTVRHMFSDLANVHVVAATDDTVAHSRTYEILSIGLHNQNWGRIAQWDEAFYRFADVPFGAKWDMFHVPKSGSEWPTFGPIVLVHHDVARGFEIDETRFPTSEPPVWLNPSSPFLTDWRNVIRDALEIHVIDSAPMHLVELLPTTGKLFYHKYARAQGSRQHTDAVLRKDWTVLE